MPAPTTDEEIDARIIDALRAKEQRNAAEEHLLAVLSGTAPPAPEIRHADFAPDDLDALRAYVAEEVALHGGLSDCVLLMLMEMDRSDATHEEAMDILSAPRLGTGPLI